MKIRNGFVSNSSSASFVIDRKYVSQDMINKIFDHEDVAEGEEWTVVMNDKEIICSTYMDNFDLLEYVRKIGVPEEAIRDVDGENYGNGY
jgi:hypothetical protein